MDGGIQPPGPKKILVILRLSYISSGEPVNLLSPPDGATNKYISSHSRAESFDMGSPSLKPSILFMH